MKRLVLLLLVFCAINAYSQSTTIDYNYDKKYNSVATNTQSGRFEIIMSDIIAKNTFKLDKKEGDVYVLCSRGDGSNVWKRIEKEEQKNDQKGQNINYQIYMSGISAKYCFLININSGITWGLFIIDDKPFFKIIE